MHNSDYQTNVNIVSSDFQFLHFSNSQFRSDVKRRRLTCIFASSSARSLKDSFEVLPITALLLRGLIEELPSASTCEDNVTQNTSCFVVKGKVIFVGLLFPSMLEPQRGQVEVKI